MDSVLYYKDGNKRNRILWMDVMRGLAIIGVVVCHQQGFLHSSEYVQFATLFSVPSLIFLMGITKGMSLIKKSNYNSDMRLLPYSFRSMFPTLLSYVFAIIVIDLYFIETEDYWVILEHILRFKAQGPYYFIGFYYILHYIKLSLWAPVLFCAIQSVNRQKKKSKRMVQFVVLFLFIWIIGYVSIGRVDIFSQSYLFVYSLGLLCSCIDLPKPTVWSGVLTAAFLFCGTFLAHRFYFARVDGNYAYAELIDMIDPKLQLNPPNLSVILYSIGIVMLVYHMVICVSYMGGQAAFRLVAILGKYSLDIFLWHIFVRCIMSEHILQYLENIWLKRIVFYFAMFGIPIVARILYCKSKNRVYEFYSSMENNQA